LVKINQLQLLGKNIHKLISSSKYKQTEIAKKLGVGDSTISKWVKGERTPTASNLIELARTLNVDITIFWQDVDTLEFSVIDKQLSETLDKLDDKQKAVLLEVAKSMLPPPEMADFLNKISQLSEVKKRALLTLAESEQ